MSQLSKIARFHYIKTPIDSSGILKHIALLDCRKEIIIEGVNNKGYLNIKLFKIYGITVTKYISNREKIQDYNFQENHIEINPVDTISTYKKHRRILNQNWINYYLKLKIKIGEDYNSVLPCESDIEERWAELKNWPDNKEKYDSSAEDGWNCESVVSYIATGKPTALQAGIVKGAINGAINAVLPFPIPLDIRVFKKFFGFMSKS